MLLLLLILPRARICWVGISMLELLLLILPEGRMLHESSMSRNILDFDIRHPPSIKHNFK